MILPISRYTGRIALKIHEVIHNNYVSDFRQLQLLIMPGEINDERRCVRVMGSPWYLHGCWPFHPTEVDTANHPRPDFPVIAYDAFDSDDEGRVVFSLDQRLWDLPDGRYTGIIRMKPIKPPINFPENIKRLQHIYTAQSHYTLEHRLTPCNYVPEPLQPVQEVCNLLTFDIDLGPQCAEHMVSQANVSFVRTDCGLEGD